MIMCCWFPRWKKSRTEGSDQSRDGADTGSILEGVNVAELVGNGSLYRVSPLNESCTAVLIGTIPDRPAEPVAWTRLYGTGKSRVFYTSLGHPDDFKEPPFRRLLLNGIIWSLKAN